MKLQYQESVLSNGVRVISSFMPSVSSVSVGVWAGVGGRYESRRNSGLSHFIEHLLFKGTRKRSAQQISQDIEGRGGYFNAFTQEESTCYYARITSNYGEEVIDTLSDMYLNPKFDSAELDKERGVIIEEIMMYRDQPNQLVQDHLGEMLWTKHSLGRPLIGTPQNIRRVTRKEIIDFKKSRYVPESTVVALAGNYPHDEAVKQIQKIYGRFKGGRIPRFLPVKASTGQERIRVVHKDIEQSHLAMGLRLFGRHDRRRFALKLLSVILGENMSSRLFQEIREKHGLAYSVHSGVHLYADTGTLAISAGLDRLRTDKAIRLIVRELNRMKNKSVTSKELRMAKDYTIGQLRIGMESSTTQMMWLGENILGYGNFYQPEHVIRKLEQVTADQVKAIAEQALKGRRVSLALVTPEDVKEQESLALKELSSL